MSTLQPLVIQTGADWGWTMTIRDGAGTPIAVTGMVIEMRRDINPTSQLLTRLDTTGQAPGLISPAGAGIWSLTLPWQVTSLIPPGRGFWDVYGTVATRRVKLGAGAVEVEPRVTAVV